MHVIRCPSEPELLAFHLGTAPAETLDRVADHLDSCPRCEAALQALDACTDPVLAALRKPVPPEEAQGSNRRKEGADFHDPTAREHWPSLPGYEILAVLGKGGMGVVYRARHLRLNRLVALKRLRSQSGQELARSRAEAEALAQLQHPNIVQIFELVEHAGQAYLTMELVEGGSLGQRLAGKPQPPHRMAELLEMLARAVQYAHDRGIVHRDLNPSNVLLLSSHDPKGSVDGKAAPSVGSQRNEWVPKLTDFGIAKRLAVESGATQEGEILGTPSYMAPEQAGGRNREIGPATDIYSLGVIVYEMLTGRVPLLGPTTLDTLMLVRTEEPVPPRRLQPKVPRDLETICLKCLEKEPGRRYPSALALAEDLCCFQQGKPIRARPVGRLERMRKWVRRRPTVAALTLAVLALVLVVTVAAPLVAFREARLRGAADARALDARAAEARARQLADSENQLRRGALYQAYRARLVAAAAALSAHDVADAEHQLEAAPAELRGWEWRHLHSRLDDSSALIRLPDRRFSFLIGAPDRLRVGAFTAEGLRLTDLVGGEQEILPIETGRGRDFAATQTRRGLRVAVWNSSKTAFDLLDEAGHVLCRVEMPEAAEVTLVVVSPDGTQLATYGSKGAWSRLAVFDATSGRPAAVWNGHRDTTWLTFSPDGTRLASASEDRTARLWDPATGALLATCRGHTSKLVSVAFRPDGTRLVTTSADGTVRQWDAATGREVEPPYERHSDEVGAAVYSPDGQWVASASADRTIRVWRATGRQDVAILHGHTWSVTRVAFDPDGRRLASLSIDRVAGVAGDDTVRVWDVDPRATLPVLRGHTSFVYPVAFSPDGRWIASGGWDNTLRLWDARTGEACRPLDNGDLVKTLAFSPEGSRVVSARQDRLQVWEVATGRRRQELQVPRPDVVAVAFRPDGATLAALDSSGGATVFNAATGMVVARLRLNAGHDTKALAYSPNGRWLAGAGADETTVCLFDAHTYEPSAQFAGHEGMIRSVTFSPDSRRLASCSSDHTVRLWQIDSGACQVLSGHTDEVFAAAFHPDGTRLATAGRDRAVWLWDLATGQEVARLPGHTSYVWSLAFSPDGATLASGSGDFTVRLWDTAPLKLRYQARHEAEALRPEAERLVEQLFKKQRDATAVVAALWTEPTLGEPLRHAAFRALLRRQSP
jgi:WD40 repeat protein